MRRDVLEQLEPPFLDLHAAEWTARDRFEIRPDARRFENWETNFAGKVGLGVAVLYALDLGLEAIRDRVYDLAERLRVRLAGIPGVVVRDLGKERCGIVTFTAEGKSPDGIQDSLTGHAVNVSVTPPASTRLDFETRDLGALVRASVHYFNTGEEVERFCTTLGEILSRA